MRALILFSEIVDNFLFLNNKIDNIHLATYKKCNSWSVN